MEGKEEGGCDGERSHCLKSTPCEKEEGGSHHTCTVLMVNMYL